MSQDDKNTSVFPHPHIDRSNWKRVRLGDLVARQTISMGRGNVISKEAIGSDPGAYPVFSSSATGDGIIGYYARYMFEDERISWSIDGGGRFFYHPASRYSVTNVSGWIKVHKPAEINTRYLYLALDAEWKKKHFDYQTKAHPSVIKNEYIIAYPDIDTQNKIATVIASCDDYITAIQSLITKYEAIKKATVNFLLKPKDNWSIVALGEICDICSTRRVHESDWTSAGVPFYRARELVALNEGREISPLHISEKLYAECVASSGAIQAGDLLVTGVGSIGVPYLVKRGDRFYFKDGNVIWFKNRGKLHPKYFLHVFKSAYIQDQIEEMSCVGTVGSYTITNGKQTLIPLPPEREQEQIVTILDSIDNTLKDLKTQLKKSQAIKQGMMTYFFE